MMAKPVTELAVMWPRSTVEFLILAMYGFSVKEEKWSINYHTSLADNTQYNIIYIYIIVLCNMYT